MIIGKEKVTSRLISLFVIFVLQIFISQCYDYLKRKSYKQTDQSVRNFFLQIIITQCYDYLKRKSYKQTDQSVLNFCSSNNYNTVL